MNKLLDLLLAFVGITMVIIFDALLTKPFRFIVRLALFGALTYFGVALVRADNMFADAHSNSFTFWMTAGIGTAFLIVAGWMAWMNFIKPFGRQMQGKGYRINL